MSWDGRSAREDYRNDTEVFTDPHSFIISDSLRFPGLLIVAYAYPAPSEEMTLSDKKGYRWSESHDDSRIALDPTLQIKKRRCMHSISRTRLELLVEKQSLHNLR